MRIRLIHLLSTIRANLVAFCSIVLFVALGAGQFLGIGWSAEALHIAVDATFEEGLVHDVEVQFPAGLTAADVEAVSEIDGVSAVEARLQTHVVAARGDDAYTVRLTTLTNDIDRVTVTDGTLPKSAGEVVLQRSLAQRANLSIGDVLEVRDNYVADGSAGEEDSDAGDEDAGETDEESEEAADGKSRETGDDADSASGGSRDDVDVDVLTPKLATGRLRVVGFVDAPEYLTNEGSMIGICDVGVGTVDFVGYVVPEAFEKSSREYYTDMVATLDKPLGTRSYDASYGEAIAATLDEIKSLGEERAQARLDELREEADSRIADAEATLDEGREQIAEGRTKLEESEQRLKDAIDELVSGQIRLEEGEAELRKKQAEGEAALAEARAEIEKGQATYDEKAAEVATAEKRLKEYEDDFAEVADVYDEAMAVYRQLKEESATLTAQLDDAQAKLDAYEAAVAAEQAQGATDAGDNESQTHTPRIITRGGDGTASAPQQKDSAALWVEFEQSYATLVGSYNTTRDKVEEHGDRIERVSETLDMDVTVDGMRGVPPKTDADEARASIEEARAGITTLNELLGLVEGATFQVEGITIRLTDVRAGLREAHAKIDDAKGELAEGKEKLRRARAEFNQKKEEFERAVNEGREQLREGAQKLEEGRAAYKRGSEELTAGKSELSRREQELKEGEGRLADAKDAVIALDGLGWIVTTRTALGAWRGPDIVASMMGDVRWAMASIFVIVGLLVCYSAVSRIVHAETAQIGTLSAMGFTQRRIASVYLLFAACAVAVGMVLSIAVALLVIEGNVNPVIARSFTIGTPTSHVNPLELLAMAVFEFATITLSAWLALRSLMRFEARELLTGDVKVADLRDSRGMRLFERLSPWVRTAILNLVSDTRRVVATLIGVCGCTALIVIALTLDADVAATPVRQYADVYDFDAIVYLDEESDEAADAVQQALEEKGLASVPIFLRQMMVTVPDGSLTFATVMVSIDDEAFSGLYHLAWKGKPIAWPADGLWVSTAFTEHRGWGSGDELRLIGADGLVADVTIAGTFDYYLLRQELVCSKGTWAASTGDEAHPNALIVDTDGKDLEELRAGLSSVEGFDRLVDDRGASTYAFAQVSDLLKIVVGVFLTLSALMAALVLLNLDVMYVEERHRELVVLMVLGFRVKDAKAYIWRDSVVLTIVGVLFGCVSGCVMANVTLRALEPITGNFVRDISWPSVGIGALVAAVFATIAMLVALREISHFNLTDVNRD